MAYPIISLNFNPAIGNLLLFVLFLYPAINLFFCSAPISSHTLGGLFDQSE